MYKAFLLSVLVLFGCVDLASAQTAALIDVGGYRLDVLRSGSGSPTVVLVGGLGNDLETWKQIVPSVAEYSTVIAYSRSGLGRSEISKLEPTVQGSVAELHALLSKLKVKPPIILVGASYGGILVRLYTSTYGDEVAGLVLVDASSEEQMNRYGRLDKAYPDAFRKSFDESMKTRTGSDLLEARESLRIQNAGKVGGMKLLPDIPMAVLTSYKPDPNAKFINSTPAGYEEWREMHDEWFKRSSNAIHIVTSKSGHHIQDDEPQLVINAIRFVLDRVRSR